MEINQAIKSFFGQGRLIMRACAPGRLDVLGGVADYSGALVLEKTIAEMAEVIVAARADMLIRIHSAAGDVSSTKYFEVDLGQLLNSQGKLEYPSLRTYFSDRPEYHWASYILGPLFVLICEKGVFCRGADIWLRSAVPIAAGVSSSAAICVAALTAFDRLFAAHCQEQEVPLLAQLAENQICGAACGIMDQTTSYLGTRETLLPIVCQPVILRNPIDIPEKLSFLGLTSGVSHAVAGKGYAKARTAAFMGYSLMAQQLGAEASMLSRFLKGTVERAELPLQGYLANMRPERFEEHFATLLPDTMLGADFHSLGLPLIDGLSEVLPEEKYPVRAATAFPIYESQRSEKMAKLVLALHGRLDSLMLDTTLAQMGELLYQSHAGYSAMGLGHPTTDKMVEYVRKLSPDEGLFGARISGGGEGGTVVLLGYGRMAQVSANRMLRHFAATPADNPIELLKGSAQGGYYHSVKETII